MRIHSQNLNEKRGVPAGSMFWSGRAWLRRSVGYDELLHVEWCLGKFADSFSIKASFGYGDSDSGVCLHIGLPWLFSIYLVIPHVYHCKECETGIAIHNDAFWFYPMSWSMESRRSDPWYRRSHAFHFPWSYDWYSTEVLRLKFWNDLGTTVWKETVKDRRDRTKDSFERMREQQEAADTVSETHSYRYVLKNGRIQNRTAKIHVVRRVWRMKWYPILPFKRVSTSIDVKFSDEVGEEAGSWKGGCIGSGYELLPDESPLECLRRMERERTF